MNGLDSPRRIEPLAGTGRRVSWLFAFTPTCTSTTYTRVISHTQALIQSKITIRVLLLAKPSKTAQNYPTQVLINIKQRQTILPETERMLISKLRKITVTSTSTSTIWHDTADGDN